MDSILKEKYSRIRTIQSSNFLFSILHFFISFGGGRRKRGGFKNSLELQGGFDSKKNLEYVQFNRLISPFLFFISSFLLEEVEGEETGEDLRIPWNCKMDSILKKISNMYNSIIEFLFFPFLLILHFCISFGEDGRRRERGGFKNSLEFKMDSILKEKYVQFNRRISPFLFFISFKIFFSRRKKNK